MSVSHARRHQTGYTVIAGDGQKRAERVHTLLSLRDRLSATAAAYEAHGIDGSLRILEEQWSIEGAIKILAPHVWEDRWIDWLEQDGQLCHTADTPHPGCYICTMNQADAA